MFWVFLLKVSLLFRSSFIHDFIILSIKITSPKYYFSFSKLAYNCLQNPHERLAFFFSFAFYFVFCNYILTQLILYFLYSDEMVKLKWMQRNLTRQFIERILIWTVGIFFSSHFTLLNYVSRFDLIFTITKKVLSSEV